MTDFSCVFYLFFIFYFLIYILLDTMKVVWTPMFFRIFCVRTRTLYRKGWHDGE